jgi:primase-polymerase (primpol)-like protein
VDFKNTTIQQMAGIATLLPTTASPRPTRTDPIWANIPDYLTARHRWVLWTYEVIFGKSGGRWSKVPKRLSRRNASSTDPGTWLTWEQVQVAFQADTDADRFFDGIGFVLTPEDGLIGWDFDRCFYVLGQIIDPAVEPYIIALNSYTEITPSGTGLRVFTRGTLPAEGRKRANFPTPKLDCECYISGRVLSVTGNRIL